MQKTIKEAIACLSDEDKNRHQEALAEGYKDEICPKCGTIFLAFHHFVECLDAKKRQCPMVSNTKSILEQVFDDKI